MTLAGQVATFLAATVIAVATPAQQAVMKDELDRLVAGPSDSAEQPERLFAAARNERGSCATRD